MVTLYIPYATKSEQNASYNHFARYGRRNQSWAAITAATVGKTAPTLPVEVTLTAVRKRLLDSDALVISLKWVRDALAQWMQTKDGPYDPVVWLYDQDHAGKDEQPHTSARIRSISADDLRLKRKRKNR